MTPSSILISVKLLQCKSRNNSFSQHSPFPPAGNLAIDVYLQIDSIKGESRTTGTQGGSGEAMKKLLQWFALLAISMPAQAERIDPAVFGRWKITSVADFAGIMADTDLADAKRLMGADLLIAPKGIKFAGEDCKNPSYSVERKTIAKAFGIGFQMSDTDNLKLPDPVTEVEVECENATEISLFYVRSKGDIVFVWSGIFFNAVQQRK